MILYNNMTFSEMVHEIAWKLVAFGVFELNFDKFCL